MPPEAPATPAPAAGNGWRRRVADVLDRSRSAELAAAQAELAEAYVNPVSGLPNRKAFEKATKNVREGAAFVMADADGLKPINDRLGHPAGDKFLANMGLHLATAAEEMGVSARNVFHIGGDEFAVLAPSQEIGSRIAARAEEIAAGEVGGINTGFSAAAGATLDEADKAMYARKAARKAERAREQAGPTAAPGSLADIFGEIDKGEALPPDMQALADRIDAIPKEQHTTDMTYVRTALSIKKRQGT